MVGGWKDDEWKSQHFKPSPHLNFNPHPSLQECYDTKEDLKGGGNRVIEWIISLNWEGGEISNEWYEKSTFLSLKVISLFRPNITLPISVLF